MGWTLFIWGECWTLLQNNTGMLDASKVVIKKKTKKQTNKQTKKKQSSDCSSYPPPNIVG